MTHHAPTVSPRRAIVSAPAAVLVALVLITLAPPAARAATYYVATTGSDSNRGTEAAPFRTVAHAVDTMVAGDTTFVRGGTYREGLMRFRRSGTATAPIRLLAYRGESPAIECIEPGPPTYARFLIQHGSGYEHAMGWITIEGLEVRNCWNGVKMYNGHDITIRNNWLHHNLSQGFLGNGTRVLLDGNIINHNGPFLTMPGSNQSHGVYANGTAWTVTNNLIYDNLGYGVQLNGSGTSTYDPARHAGPEFAVSDDWLIANNTFAYQHNRAGIVVWGSTCNNARIENNIFYENAVTLASGDTQGISFVSTSCTGVRIRNNLSFASGSGGTRFLGTRATEGTHYTQSDNIVGDPRFVGAGAALPERPDFALGAGSPAIDSGRDLTADGVRTDYNGNSRPAGRAFDIGAFEFASAAMPDPDAGPVGPDAGSLERDAGSLERDAGTLERDAGTADVDTGVEGAGSSMHDDEGGSCSASPPRGAANGTVLALMAGLVTALARRARRRRPNR
jgi:hypothetical protein